MSLSFSIYPVNRKTQNPAILYFVVAFKTQIKMQDQKDDEDRLAHALDVSLASPSTAVCECDEEQIGFGYHLKQK